MNAEASHRLVSKPSSLVRLHALFNTGALTGAAAAALVIHAGVSWRWVWPAIAVVALAVGVWALATDPGTALVGGHETAGHRRPGAHPAAAAAPRRPPGPAGRLRPGRGHRGRRRHLGRPLPAQPPGHRRAARRRGVRRRASSWPRPPAAPAGRCSAGCPPGSALIVGGCVAGGGILLESVSPCGHRRGGARPRRGRGLALLAPGHEHGQPAGQPGRQCGGHLHRRGLRGLGGRGAHRRLGLADLRARPRPAGPGPGLLRRRRLHRCSARSARPPGMAAGSLGRPP